MLFLFGFNLLFKEMKWQRFSRFILFRNTWHLLVLMSQTECSTLCYHWHSLRSRRHPVGWTAPKSALWETRIGQGTNKGKVRRHLRQEQHEEEWAHYRGNMRRYAWPGRRQFTGRRRKPEWRIRTNWAMKECWVSWVSQLTTDMLGRRIHKEQVFEGGLEETLSPKKVSPKPSMKHYEGLHGAGGSGRREETGVLDIFRRQE